MEKKINGGVVIGYVNTTVNTTKPAEEQESVTEAAEVKPVNKGGRPKKK